MRPVRELQARVAIAWENGGKSVALELLDEAYRLARAEVATAGPIHQATASSRHFSIATLYFAYAEAANRADIGLELAEDMLDGGSTPEWVVHKARCLHALRSAESARAFLLTHAEDDPDGRIRQALDDLRAERGLAVD